MRTLWTRGSVRRSPSSCARSVRACQGSETAQRQTAARSSASVHIAFHSPTGVGTLNKTAFAAPYPAYARPYQLLVCLLTETSAWLGADVVRYTFIVEDFHLLLLTSLLANLGVVSHGTGKCPSPVFPRVHPDPNTSAVRSTGYCAGMIMRLRGSVCTRGVLQVLATSNAMYPAWFLRGRGWRTSSAPLPQWKRHPMPGGGAPVVRELPS